MNLDDIFERYHAFREGTRPIADRLLTHVTGEQIDEGARRLELKNKKGVMVFDSESGMAVLMDFCLFCVLDQGKTVIDKALENPDELDDQERNTLRAMAASRYTVLIVEQIFPGTGVICLDLVNPNAQPFFIADVMLSQTADRGAVFATRIVPVDEFYMTGGAALPVYGQEVLLKSKEILHSHRERHPEILEGIVRRESDAALAERMTRMLMRHGMGSSVAYLYETADQKEISEAVDYLKQSDLSAPALDRHASARRHKTGPNEPCPCGSGKKYKKCCGSRH